MVDTWAGGQDKLSLLQCDARKVPFLVTDYM